MDKGQRQADDQACKGTVFKLRRCDSLNHHQEDKCEDDLHQKSGNKASVDTGKAVAAVTAGHICHAACREDHSKQDGPDKCTDYLEDPVHDSIFGRNRLAHQHCQSNSRIEMSAGNITDTISHGNNRQAKSKSCKKITASGCRITADKHRCTAAHEDQDTGSDHFRKIFFHLNHSFPLCFGSIPCVQSGHTDFPPSFVINRLFTSVSE